jgi:acetylornithine/LysW-gamma-L-lysine aminotransferase
MPASNSNSRAIEMHESRHTSGAYSKRPVAIVRGKASTLYDESGEAYLDLTSGHGVALLGHGHPALVEAVQRQAGRLITCPEIFYNDMRSRLYSQLQEILPPGMWRFFLCNSGAEAIEAAMKLARLLTGRPEILSLQGAFHGRTLGALSATWNPKYREPFRPLVPDFHFIPADDIGAAGRAIGAHTAAVLLEVVQGEGGVRPLRGEFLSQVATICQGRGALLVVDEIQTGLGRTGRWFAFEHHGLSPDVICLGKGLAGGLPMGLVAWRGELGAFAPHSHGSTFGGNPLACAAALATLETLQRERFYQRGAAVGEPFIQRMRAMDHALIREVRGLGLMIGIDLRRRATPVLKSLLRRHVLALSAGSTVLRLLPPLIIDRKTLMGTCRTITEALEDAYGD